MHTISKKSTVVVAACTLITLIVGSRFSAQGMNWYQEELLLPAFTPPDWIFGVVWAVLYLLTAYSVLIAWNELKRNAMFAVVLGLFVLNALLNVFWSWVFFVQHNIGGGIAVASALWWTVMILMGILWKRSPIAARLLIPYALWGAFAIYLNYQIYLMNVG